jgi:hypothetical protein
MLCPSGYTLALDPCAFPPVRAGWDHEPRGIFEDLMCNSPTVDRAGKPRARA